MTGPMKAITRWVRAKPDREATITYTRAGFPTYRHLVELKESDRYMSRAAHRVLAFAAMVALDAARSRGR